MKIPEKLEVYEGSLSYKNTPEICKINEIIEYLEQCEQNVLMSNPTHTK